MVSLFHFGIFWNFHKIFCFLLTDLHSFQFGFSSRSPLSWTLVSRYIFYLGPAFLFSYGAAFAQKLLGVVGRANLSTQGSSLQPPSSQLPLHFGWYAVFMFAHFCFKYEYDAPLLLFNVKGDD
jgi:hypothetical protein